MEDRAAEALLEAARAGELDRLGEQRDEVAAAVRGLAAAGEGASALELVALTWRIWFSRGEIDEGSAAARGALDAPGAHSPSSNRARVLYADGLFAFRAGDQERSRRRNEEALEVARAVGDGRGEAEALTGLARVALRDGDYASVVELARQGRARAPERAAETAPLHLEAAGKRLSGDYRGARELYLESLALNDELGNSAWVAMEQHNLGWVELHLGDVDAAEQRFRAAAQDDSTAYDAAWRDLNRAALAAARGDRDEARSRFDSGMRALDGLGLALDPDDASEVEWLRAQLQ